MLTKEQQFHYKIMGINPKDLYVHIVTGPPYIPPYIGEDHYKSNIRIIHVISFHIDSPHDMMKYKEVYSVNMFINHTTLMNKLRTAIRLYDRILNNIDNEKATMSLFGDPETSTIINILDEDIDSKIRKAIRDYCYGSILGKD